MIGPNDPIGPRFPSLLNAYDADLRATLKETAAEKGITLHEVRTPRCRLLCFGSPPPVLYPCAARLPGRSATGLLAWSKCHRLDDLASVTALPRVQRFDCNAPTHPTPQTRPRRQGVYVATLGPSFETPAEIRAFKVLGADVVGMSCVPEVIVARHCGLKVVATTIVVNYASGMSDKDITHEETLHYTGVAAENVTNLIMGFIDKVKDGADGD